MSTEPGRRAAPFAVLKVQISTVGGDCFSHTGARGIGDQCWVDLRIGETGVASNYGPRILGSRRRVLQRQN
jgi:hypothetical protein